MTEQELWMEYCNKSHVSMDTPHEAWSFGDDPDMLLGLVLSGRKTATSSLECLYELESEVMPAEGDISILLNKNGDASAILRNTGVSSVLFSEVTEAMARKEGEGDGSLSYWRQVHLGFFKKEALEYGLSFHEDMKVVFEEFEVVYIS